MQTVVFDQQNVNWQDSKELTLHFLRCQQNFFNHTLLVRGHVFLNEVYDALCIKRTIVGAISGWSRKENPKGYIDFGLGGIGDASKLTEFNLMFNIDGCILHTIED